jgi:hypothetical protein
MKGLAEAFHALIASSIDAVGVYPHKCLHVKDGKLTMAAIMINDPGQVYAALLAICLNKKPDEIIFGLDRYCKPGQGTTLGDCITGANFAAGVWKPFVIEYQHEPRIVQPIQWDNPFWNAHVMDELRHFRLAKEVPS